MADRGEHDDDIRAAVADLVSGSGKDTALEKTLSSAAAAAVDLVDGVDYADVMVTNEDRMRAVKPDDADARDLDDVQLRLQQGPCLQAAVSGAMIRCTDDDRRPGFAAMAAGVHSTLSFQLDTHDNGWGALNLFGRAPRQIDPAAEAIGAPAGHVGHGRTDDCEQGTACHHGAGQPRRHRPSQGNPDELLQCRRRPRLRHAQGPVPRQHHSLRNIAEQIIDTL